MSDLIKVITAPDIIYDQSKKIFSICAAEDLVNKLKEWAVDQEEAISLYCYNTKDDLNWLMTMANISDVIILDMDFVDTNINSFVSYLLSFPKTHYRCNHMIQPWNLLNINRFYDFPNL